MMKCSPATFNGGCCASNRIRRAPAVPSFCDCVRTSSSTLDLGRSVVFSRTPEGVRLTGSIRITEKSGQKRQGRVCRAALADDAPFALAIGASILSTLVLPTRTNRTDKKEEPLLGADDVFSGAMQIISFVPLFNWLVWVFAYLDTRKPQYLAYTAVYLAPYLKTGLSLSPEDSWLPIASIIACVAHVQLDLSVNVEGRSPLGDLSKVYRESAQTDSVDQAAQPNQEPDRAALKDSDGSGEAAWNAVLDEAQKKEFTEWDNKFSRSRVTEENARETDA